VHRVLAAVNIARDDLDKAIYHEERGLNLSPNDDFTGGSHDRAAEGVEQGSPRCKV